MTWLDIAFIAVLCAAAGLGFWSGFMWQLYGLFCLVLSYFAALLLHGIVSGPFEQGLGPDTARSVGYAVVFSVVFITSYSLGLLIRKLLRLRPGRIGRVLGLFLGLLQASLICGVVAVGLVDYSTGSVKQAAESSRVVTTLARGAHFLRVLIPGDIRKGVGAVKERSEEAIRDAAGEIKGAAKGAEDEK